VGRMEEKEGNEDESVFEEVGKHQKGHKN